MGGLRVASGWLKQISLVLFHLPVGGSRYFVSFIISFISYVSGWLACGHWAASFVLVYRVGVLFSFFFF